MINTKKDWTNIKLSNLDHHLDVVMTIMTTALTLSNPDAHHGPLLR